MKKYLIVFMLVASITIVPFSAKAVTLDDLAKQIAGLKREITALRAQVAAQAISRTTAVTAPTTTTATTKVVAPTLTTTVAPTTKITTTTITPTTTTTKVVTPTTLAPATLKIPTTLAPATLKAPATLAPATLTTTKTTTAATSPATTLTKATTPVATVVPTTNTTGAIVLTDTATFGDTNLAVKNLQKRLAQIGYFKGTVDSNFGQATKLALCTFQVDTAVTTNADVSCGKNLGKVTIGKLNAFTGTASSAGKGPNDPTPTVAGCVQPPTGMVSWWSGDGFADDIKGSNDGVLNGTASASGTGKVDKAFSFKGSDAFVDVPFSTTLNPTPSGAMTIDYWVKRTNASSALESHVCKQFKSENFYCVQSQGGNIIFSVTDSTGKTATAKTNNSVLPVGVWKHVAVVFSDSRFLPIYIDGVEQTNITTKGVLINNIRGTSSALGPVNVNTRFGGDQSVYTGSGGKNQNSNPFIGGNLDEIEFFNRALTTAEINSIYLAGSFGKCKRADSYEKGNLKVILKTFLEDNSGQTSTFAAPNQIFDFITGSNTGVKPNGGAFDLDTEVGNSTGDNVSFMALPAGNYKVEMTTPSLTSSLEKAYPGKKWEVTGVSCSPSTGITSTIIGMSSAKFEGTFSANQNTVCTFKATLANK